MANISYIYVKSNGTTAVSSLTWEFSTAQPTGFGHTLSSDADTIVALLIRLYNTNNRTVSSVTSNSAGLTWHEAVFEPVTSSGNWHPCGVFWARSADITSDDFTINIGGGTAAPAAFLYEITSANTTIADWSTWPVASLHKSTNATFDFGGDLDFSDTGEDDGVALGAVFSPSGILSAGDADWTYNHTGVNQYVGRIGVSGQPNESHDVSVSGGGNQTGVMAAIGSKATGATDLTVRSPVHLHALGRLALIQQHNLTARSLRHVHTAERVVMVQGHNLTTRSAAHVHTAPRISLTQAHALSLRRAIHLHAAERPALTQAHALSVRGAVHPHTAALLALTQAHALSVRDTVHTHTAARPALTQVHNLSLRDAVHLWASQQVDLTPALLIRSAFHGHVAAVVALTQVHGLTARSAVHAHTVPRLALTQAHNLTARSTYHGQFAPRLSLSQVHGLTVRDTVHSQVAGRITAVPVLVVRSTIHGQYAPALSVVQAQLLVVRGVVHDHYAGRIILPGGPRALEDIQLSVDGYCTLACVEAVNPLRDFTATSKPTRAQVGGMITDYFEHINGMLYVLGYQMPLASGNATALGILGRLNCLGAAALAEEAAFSAGNKEGSTHSQRLFQLYDVAWEDLADGWSALPGVDRKANYIPRKHERRADSGFAETPDGDAADPTFTRDMDF